ncbi:hypothetical protein HanRHA438_Chr16g0752521 [Helianthus annuus]|nr:hypothetical protein HanRHA438_Chr16g0752521 [Helianthus annuus]
MEQQNEKLGYGIEDWGIHLRGICMFYFLSYFLLIVRHTVKLVCWLKVTVKPLNQIKQGLMNLLH